MKEIKDRIIGSEKIDWRILKPFQPENLKEMSKESFKLLKNSITLNDFNAAFDIWKENDENYWILDGHHRKFALESLEKDGYKIPEKFQCTIIDCKNKKDAANIIITKASSHARMTETGFTEFIANFELDTQLLMETIDIPNFDIEEILKGIKTDYEPQCDEDEVPELKGESTSKLGDIWILGDHRLMCGDCTMMDSVEKLMNGENANLVYTDPPYGINLETDYKKRYGHEKSSSESQFDGEDEGIDLKAIIANSHCVGAKEVFVWGADNYPDCLPRGGSWVVWDKSTAAVDGIASDFELCWSRERHHYSLYRKLWKGVKAREETGQEGAHRTRWGHPTQKPIELAVYFLDKWGKKAKTVLDFFGGSGTTLIACEKTNRKCYMMEISPNYCDIIVKRWQKFSGKKAIHEESGKKFDELSHLV